MLFVCLPAFAFLSFFFTLPAAIGIVGTNGVLRVWYIGSCCTTFLAVVLFGPWNGRPVGLFAAVGVGVGR